MAKKEDIKNGVNVTFDGGIIINDKSLKEEEKKEENIAHETTPVEDLPASGAIGPDTSIASDITNDIPVYNAVDEAENNDIPTASYSTSETYSYEPNEKSLNTILSSPEEWKNYIDNLYRTKPQEDVKVEVERIGGTQAELVGYLIKTLNEVADKHGVPTNVHKKLEEINEMNAGKKEIDEVLGKNTVSDSNAVNFPYYGEDNNVFGLH